MQIFQQACIGIIVERLFSPHRSNAKQRRLELDRLQSAMSSPSEFAKLGVWSKEQKTLQMMIHRPHDNFDTHVSLYYHGFDQFTARCESLELDKDDAECVL